MSRERWIVHPKTGELVPADEYVRPINNFGRGPMIISDIQPYKSMITGEMITSRSRHAAHLREHGAIEMGNDPAAMAPPRRKKADRAAIRAALKRTKEQLNVTGINVRG